MKMWLISAATMLCAGAATAPRVANAAGSSFFISGSVGRSSIDNGGFDTNDTGHQVDIGYRWTAGSNVLIGVEAGYADLGKFSSNSSPSGIETEERGPTLGANLRFNVASDWYIGARAGYLRADFTASTHFGQSHGETLDAWYAGIGFGHDFSDHLSVGIAYDYFDAHVRGIHFDPSLIGVSAEYRF